MTCIAASSCPLASGALRPRMALCRLPLLCRVLFLVLCLFPLVLAALRRTSSGDPHNYTFGVRPSRSARRTCVPPVIPQLFDFGLPLPPLSPLLLLLSSPSSSFRQCSRFASQVMPICRAASPRALRIPRFRVATGRWLLIRRRARCYVTNFIFPPREPDASEQPPPILLFLLLLSPPSPPAFSPLSPRPTSRPRARIERMTILLKTFCVNDNCIRLQFSDRSRTPPPARPAASHAVNCALF
jgi:hypothetical protein